MSVCVVDRLAVLRVCGLAVSAARSRLLASWPLLPVLQLRQGDPTDKWVCQWACLSSRAFDSSLSTTAGPRSSRIPTAVGLLARNMLLSLDPYSRLP